MSRVEQAEHNRSLVLAAARRVFLARATTARRSRRSPRRPASPRASSTPSSRARPTCSWRCSRPASPSGPSRTRSSRPAWPGWTGCGPAGAPTSAVSEEGGDWRCCSSSSGCTRRGIRSSMAGTPRPRPHGRARWPSVLAGLQRAAATSLRFPARQLAELHAGPRRRRRARAGGQPGRARRPRSWPAQSPACSTGRSGHRPSPAGREEPGMTDARAGPTACPAVQAVRRATGAPLPGAHRAARLGRRPAGRPPARRGCGRCWRTRPSTRRSTPAGCAGST